jgi:hypothetical protein
MNDCRSEEIIRPPSHTNEDPLENFAIRSKSVSLRYSAAPADRRDTTQYSLMVAPATLNVELISIDGEMSFIKDEQKICET